MGRRCGGKKGEGWRGDVMVPSPPGPGGREGRGVQRVAEGETFRRG